MSDLCNAGAGRSRDSYDGLLYRMLPNLRSWGPEALPKGPPAEVSGELEEATGRVGW